MIMLVLRIVSYYEFSSVTNCLVTVINEQNCSKAKQKVILVIFNLTRIIRRRYTFKLFEYIISELYTDFAFSTSTVFRAVLRTKC